jgi:hypothetical protein
VTQHTQHIQLALAAEASHQNQRLLSDYFLDHMLPGEEPWRAAWLRLAEEAAPVMARLQAIQRRFRPGGNEAQTEDDWIKPVLVALGHTFEVQATLRTPDGAKRPDYIFYRDDDARLVNKRHALLDDALLNQRLQAWWELPFNDFRAGVVKSFKRDIPVKDRDDWETLLRARSAEIAQLTGEITRLETQLNAAVYAAFGLNDDEIVIVEQETKYGYGEW